MQRYLSINSTGILQDSNSSDNVIINGNFDINQSGKTSFDFSSTPATTSMYTLDQWIGSKTGSGAFTITTSADVPSALNVGGFPGSNSLGLTVTTSQAVLSASDYYVIQTRIEGYRFRTIVGKPFTISFWAKSTKTGIYCVSIRNGDNSLSYIAKYSINQVNTWEKKIITVPMPPVSSGGWNFDIGLALSITWSFASGANYLTSALNTWISGLFHSTTDAVNLLDVAGNSFQLALVKLEAGVLATPFEHLDFETNLILCRRYYSQVRLSGQFTASFTEDMVCFPFFLTNFMRVIPTVKLITVGYRVNTNTQYPPAIILYNQRDGSFQLTAANAGWCCVDNETWEFKSRL